MHDLVIVGAGAAGLGAARAALEHGLDMVLIEASHRIGGRAYSEEILPGVPFDLGCHWLHSASLNPFVEIADRLGVAYERTTNWSPALRLSGRWADDGESDDFMRYWEACDQVIEACRTDGRDGAVADIVDRDSPWVSFCDYWTALMTSSDSDRVSALDLATYLDTGENWPVTGGYGNLVARFGAGIPVTLNSAVERIERRRTGVRVHTVSGVVETRAVLVTVSTGILANDRIAFDPPLPDWKREAVAAVPLGTHNRIAIAFDGDPFAGAPSSIIDMDEEVPMLLHIKPYGHDYAVGVTGGRFAQWLERAGAGASVDHVMSRLKRIFGADVEKSARGHLVTAWGGDPWTLGAYSTCLPGRADQREVLATPIDDQLWFAGEATSPRFFATCHGAYLSGIDAVGKIAALRDETRTDEEAS